MKMHIQSHHGYIKRKGERSVPKKLRIEIQDQTESSKDGAIAFKENAAKFLVRPSFYAGIIFRITNEEGRTSLSSLEEHSVKLTISQTESLITGLRKTLDELANRTNKK
jgi:hypothetical protein